jgi:hypothetical protein
VTELVLVATAIYIYLHCNRQFTSVLFVYGLEDTIAPLDHAVRFDNDLKWRHHFEIMPLAVYNIYGELSEHGKPICGS